MTTLIDIIDLTGRVHWINPDHVARVQDTTPGRCVIRMVEGQGTVSSNATANEIADRLRTAP